MNSFSLRKSKSKKESKSKSYDHSDIDSLRNDIMDRMMENLQKKIKASTFYKLNDPNVPTRIKKVIPSGLPNFDLISARTPLGRCGLPVGRQMELFGSEASGKTSLACLMAGSAQQRLGWNVLWLEAENKLDPDRAELIGLNVGDTVFSQPNCLEDAIETIDAAMDDIPEKKDLPEGMKNFGTIVVVDSVAALPSQAELDGDMSDNNIGVFQRKMSQAQRRITNRLSKRNMNIIWINQERSKIGMGARGGVTTYGGRALKYYCAQRWKLWSQTIKKDGQAQGIKMHINNVKNQCGIRPYLEAEVILDFDIGFDYVDSWVIAMQNLSIVERSGNSYVFRVGDATGSKFSRNKLREMFDENPQFFYDYEKLMKDNMESFHALKKERKGGGDSEE